MSDVQELDEFVKKYAALKSEIAKVIVGQDKVVDTLLISIFFRRPFTFGRCAWPCENAYCQYHLSSIGPRLQKSPIHSRSNAK